MILGFLHFYSFFIYIFPFYCCPSFVNIWEYCTNVHIDYAINSHWFDIRFLYSISDKRPSHSTWTMKYVCADACVYVYAYHKRIRNSHSVFTFNFQKLWHKIYISTCIHTFTTHSQCDCRQTLACEERKRKERENSMYVALKCKSNETPHVFYSLLMSVFYNPRLMWCVNTFSFTILTNTHTNSLQFPTNSTFFSSFLFSFSLSL